MLGTWLSIAAAGWWLLSSMWHSRWICGGILKPYILCFSSSSAALPFLETWGVAVLVRYCKCVWGCIFSMLKFWSNEHVKYLKRLQNWISLGYRFKLYFFLTQIFLLKNLKKKIKGIPLLFVLGSFFLESNNCWRLMSCTVALELIMVNE